MRATAGLTLKQAAQLSGYTIGAINGEELHRNGSERLRAKLKEIYEKQNQPPPADPPETLREGEDIHRDLATWRTRATTAERELHEIKTTLRRIVAAEPEPPPRPAPPVKTGRISYDSPSTAEGLLDASVDALHESGPGSPPIPPTAAPSGGAGRHKRGGGRRS